MMLDQLSRKRLLNPYQIAKNFRTSVGTFKQAQVDVGVARRDMSKKIVMITTEHLIQENDYAPQGQPTQGEFRNILLYLVATFSPQLILEEWRPDGSATIGRRVADEKMAGAWRAIGPPSVLNLSWHGYRNLDGLMLREYGPIASQTNREQYMLDQIRESVVESEVALLIAGLAHHQSLAEKLTSLCYEVEAFYWLRPGGTVPDCVSSVWNWITD